MDRQKISVIWVVFSLEFILLFVCQYLYFAKKNALSYLPLTSLPVVKKEGYLPLLSAKSAIVMDAESGVVLFKKDPYLRLHPASITKMAAAIAALELYPVDEVIEVKEEYPVGKVMELVKGERITVGNLFYGLLVHSANDAAYILAGQSPENVANFIDRMNEFSKKIGLYDTHFVNFDGEDDQNHYSTAFDLAHLTRWALKNNLFREAIQLKEMTVTDIDGLIVHKIESTNELLGVIPEIKGVKTGWTSIAGECFVGLIEEDGRRLITVILGSNDRFGETKMLIDWVKNNVYWENYSDHSVGIAET